MIKIIVFGGCTPKRADRLCPQALRRQNGLFRVRDQGLGGANMAFLTTGLTLLGLAQRTRRGLPQVLVTNSDRKKLPAPRRGWAGQSEMSRPNALKQL